MDREPSYNDFHYDSSTESADYQFPRSTETFLSGCGCIHIFRISVHIAPTLPGADFNPLAYSLTDTGKSWHFTPRRLSLNTTYSLSFIRSACIAFYNTG